MVQCTLIPGTVFVCLILDYRGWFISDTRLVSEDQQAGIEKDGFLSARVTQLCAVVVWFHQNLETCNYLVYLQNEDCVDTNWVSSWRPFLVRSCNLCHGKLRKNQEPGCPVRQRVSRDEFSEFSAQRAANLV